MSCSRHHLRLIAAFQYSKSLKQMTVQLHQQWPAYQETLMISYIDCRLIWWGQILPAFNLHIMQQLLTEIPRFANASCMKGEEKEHTWTL